MARSRTANGRAEAGALADRIAAMPNYAEMERILEHMARGAGPLGRRVKKMLRNMSDHLRAPNPLLPPLDRMQMRFKKGLILWFCENSGAVTEMRTRVPKVTESLPG
jgi:hypothetical protein